MRKIKIIVQSLKGKNVGMYIERISRIPIKKTL